MDIHSPRGSDRAEPIASGPIIQRDGHSAAVRCTRLPGQPSDVIQLELDEAIYTLSPAEADALGIGLRQRAAEVLRGTPRVGRTEAAVAPANAVPVSRRVLVALLRAAAPHSTPAADLLKLVEAAGWATPPLSRDLLDPIGFATCAKLDGWAADMLYAASWGAEAYGGLPERAEAGKLLRATAALMRRPGA